MSGTNPFPLAPLLLLESLLPELLGRAALLWWSSFLWRLVVSCTKLFLHIVLLHIQHWLIARHHFIYRNATTLITFWKNWNIPCQKWCHRYLSMTALKQTSSFTHVTWKPNNFPCILLSSLKCLCSLSSLVWRHVYTRLVEKNVSPSRAELLVFLMSAALCEVQWDTTKQILLLILIHLFHSTQHEILETWN